MWDFLTDLNNKVNAAFLGKAASVRSEPSSSSSNLKKNKSTTTPEEGADLSRHASGGSESRTDSNGDPVWDIDPTVQQANFAVVPDVKVEDERSLAMTGGLDFTGELLTVEGGAIKVPDESRNLCALFDSGLWLVSASHRNSPLVTSVAQTARRLGYKMGEPRYVTPNIVRQAYQNANRRTVTARLDENAVRRRIVEMLQRAVEVGANDIHIEASEGRTRIEFRIDGALRLWETWTQKEGEQALSAVYSHSVGQSGATANWQEPQAAMLTSTAQGRDAIVLPKGVISVRCQWVPLSDGGRYLDMRLQYDSAHLFGENFVMADVDSLGFSQEQLKVIQSLRNLPGGMRVFAGPVNQGKTTTLRMALNRRMAETNMQLNCLLVEDPPEGGILSARQVGVSASVKDEQRERAFIEIMRCALRLDPDIVMLGEVRDIQTAKFAFRLSLTGRQVYTTTHVYAALAIPQRLRDIGIEPYLVYDYHLLRGMICQRLLRCMCPHCRIPLAQAPVELGPMYKDIIRRTRAGLALMDASRSRSTEGTVYDRLSEPDMRNVYVANPEGCPQCYKGRVGRTICAEVIETDQKIMELLADNRLEDASNYWLSPHGMNGVTMLWHSLEKIRRGEVSPQDAEFEVGPLARERDILAVEERLGGGA
ncbi:MAG: Flp pilus assembly complex ATPase component TadA [Alphaproteobacteria bacterium]|nr:Flp pilus assembly complex ATPase component TadA [Alphaproteobacteria bacterium]